MMCDATRARRLADRIARWHACGITGRNLRDRLIASYPASLHRNRNGVTMRCFGLELPPSASTQRAILDWSRLAKAVT